MKIQNGGQTILFDNNEWVKNNEDAVGLPTILSKVQKEKFENYNLDLYIKDIENLGLKQTWKNICNYIVSNGENNGILKTKNFTELYEMGLAIVDKTKKRQSGQYYTPHDVATVMCRWLEQVKGSAVCDVGCGTGQLILTYLELIGYENARKIITSGNVYLYDSDSIALRICAKTIAAKYGNDVIDFLHCFAGDFLNGDIKLPKNAKVISNPPYSKISGFTAGWEITEVIKDTKEYYSAFMEKIVDQSESAVIITPFSFISGGKYESLRKKMCQSGYGFIVSFDNVPGNIFRGKKHGVFNTNTANSVRAAITVFNKSDAEKGYRVSPLIRFKNEERDRLLIPDVLESVLPDNPQTIDSKNRAFKKIEKNLNSVYENLIDKSEYTVRDFVTKNKTGFLIDVPNTCRYYTTASHRKLNRAGSVSLYVEEKDVFNFVYCVINSSFAYWWWRIYDGGITYPKGLLYDMPLPFNLLSDEDKKFFSNVCEEMICDEANYIIKKVNAGTVQENIKFPNEYRKKINNRILNILGTSETDGVFNRLHSNHFFL